jgi:hypothetical protein
MGFVQTFEAQQASGTSTSSYIDLGNTHFDMMAVRYVTMSTGAQVNAYICDAMTPTSAASATFYPVQLQTAVTGRFATWAILTSVSGGRWAHFRCPPTRFIQFVTSDVVSGGVSYTVVTRGNN